MNSELASTKNQNIQKIKTKFERLMVIMATLFVRNIEQTELQNLPKGTSKSV